MSNDKYSRKVKLTAVEISAISMSLRESVRNAKKANKEEAEEYNKMLDSLRKRFQRLAVKIEKEVLGDIKSLR